MGFSPPDGWDRETDTLYIHDSGARIERRLYRQKEGWFLIPADLDQEVLGFDPTPEGRDQAFAAFAQGKLKPPKKKKTATEEAAAPAKRGRKPKAAAPAEEEAEGEEGEEAEGEGEGDEDEDDDEP
jgi:hypothetical protein